MSLMTSMYLLTCMYVGDLVIFSESIEGKELPHPPYFPDLSLCCFIFLIPKI